MTITLMSLNEIKIAKKNNLKSFSGYANQKEATDKKIIKDLFKKNQNAFNTGKLNE
jgi:hypothetical protein